MALRDVLELASCTDSGIVRSFNEDSIATSPEIGLLVLADGMGGYKAGDVASSLATSVVTRDIKQSFRQDMDDGKLSQLVSDAIKNANSTICRTAHGDARYQGMGTTLVMALFRDNRATVAHVGDSRLYRLRNDRLELLTHDHSLLQEQVELGLITSEDAKVSHNRNLVTRALGVVDDAELDLLNEKTLPEDIYLLCSDGLNDMVDDADIELVLSSLKANLPLAARQLVMIANDNGGHDNVSVILARVREPNVAQQGWFNKILDLFR
jgi:serine/threonine protein phosphatase PrpC